MTEPNMLGAYGDWAASLVPDGPARFSFRGTGQTSLETWKREARDAVRLLLAQPDTGGTPKAELRRRFEYDGLQVEHLRWQLPFGPPTEAYCLRPAGCHDRLPGVVAFHDHAGDKYFGTRKVVKFGDDQHPLMSRHQAEYYGGVAWANELARRGYVVLVHDAFLFGSRRVRVADVPPVLRGDLKEPAGGSSEEVEAYNRFADRHEHVAAKSLLCAGTTWPGVFTAEDQRALDYLASRPDVDPDRLGCAGLSGGGLRTVFLAGLDDRIRCACCAGMMTTWKDFLLQKSHAHTWMIYVPGLPPLLDYPEILGLRAPLPTLVLNDTDDELFSLDAMREADFILREVYRKAGAPDHYKASFYPGPHRFDRAMQDEAFAWLDRWLRS